MIYPTVINQLTKEVFLILRYKVTEAQREALLSRNWPYSTENRKFINVSESVPLESWLDQVIPDQDIKSYFLRIHFHIIYPTHLYLSNSTFFSVLWIMFCIHFSPALYAKNVTSICDSLIWQPSYHCVESTLCKWCYLFHDALFCSEMWFFKLQVACHVRQYNSIF